MPARHMSGFTIRAKAYLITIALAGLACSTWAFAHWHTAGLARFICYLVLTVVSSTFKVTLPGVTGTMSVNFLFVLIGVLDLSLAETLALGCGGALVQVFWNARLRPRPVHVIFNVGSMANSAAASYVAYHLPAGTVSASAALILACCVYFAVNTLSVAGVIALTEAKSLGRIWRECYFWSLPYYLVGACLVGLIRLPIRVISQDGVFLILPIVFIIYRSYVLYLGRLEAEKKHVEEMAGLHLRTIEALALSIDAKDNTTHDHLQRVQIYATAIGVELGMSQGDLEALRAASLLHDIGKLAVPEHIISKPGRLTPEEFEKMKIHPVVGAEILERVNFPYPVVPMVRYHHEKWNGQGYPEGLQGEQIPLGARILAAVDCLDAMASDRQYRRALPLDEVMAHIASESGSSFDPKVVEVLRRRYVELEQKTHAARSGQAIFPVDRKIREGCAPDAGFEAAPAAARAGAENGDFRASIAAAQQEFHMLFELAHDLGSSLSLDETLSVLAVRLKRMLPYDCIAIYVNREGRLVPVYVNGEDSRLFSSLEIPLGQGLSGWVAENRKPILNGNPSVEPGYLNNTGRFSMLSSALAVPLVGLTEVVGVLTLYCRQKDAFTKDHLRILQAVSAKLGMSVENALRYHQAERSAATDEMTGLPNARSLFLHLDSEVARCRRLGQPLAVLVCDLDGFKQVNDRFGHLVGNKVLRLFAGQLRGSCREYDYVARMGGDEFVFILPGFRPEALDSKKRLLQQVAEEVGERVSGEKFLSVSVGEALLPDHGIDTEQLLAEADRRMYQAKERQKLARGLTVPAYTVELPAAVIQ